MCGKPKNRFKAFFFLVKRYYLEVYDTRAGSFAAVQRHVTQRSFPQTAVSGERRCVTSPKTAMKETSWSTKHRIS